MICKNAVYCVQEYEVTLYRRTMDTVTHCLIGTFTYSLLPRVYKVKNLLLASIVLANIPDIDVLFAYTQELYLALHRGITHSIFLVPLISLLFAYIIMRWIIPKETQWRYATMYGYVVLLLMEHIYADVVTNYGTMIFMPFSAIRIRIPGLFIIDLVVIALLIIGSILGFKRRYKGAYSIAVLLFFYPLLSYGIGSFVEQSVHTRYAPLLSEKSRVIVYPAPFAPLYWNVIIEDDTTYYQTKINIVTQSITPLIQYSRLDDEFIESLKKQGRFFQLYSAFADDMLVITKRDADKISLAPLYTIPIGEKAFGNTSSFLEITLHEKDNVIEKIDLFPAIFLWRYDTPAIIVEEPFSLPNMSAL